MPDNQGPYVIEHGDVWFVRPDRLPGAIALGMGKTHICGPHDMLAIVFDEQDGTLHKHGRSEPVEKWADRTRAALTAGGQPELAEALVMVSFPVLPETVAELNACTSGSGRVMRLRERLTEIGAAVDPSAIPRRYPA